MEIENKNKGNMLAVGVCFALFFMIAFVTNFAGAMGPILKNQFGASNMASQLGSAANFFAYFFMGIPGGLILKRKGYKYTALLAAAVGFAGVGVQLMSAYCRSGGAFAVYVTGAFIAGFSMCLLNLVVNPLLNTLGGGGNKGNQLVQFGCSLNSIGATLSPIILGWLIGGEVAKANVGQAVPALVIAMSIFAVAFLVIAFSRIPEPHLETAEEKANRTPVMQDIKATLKFRHFTLGALAIFMYITVETGIPNQAMLYMTAEKGGAGLGAVIAGSVCGAYWFCMMLGRLFGGVLGAKFSSRAQITVCSVLGIALMLATIYTPATCTINLPSIPKSFWGMVLTALVVSSAAFGLAKVFGKQLSFASITGLVAIVILLWHVSNPGGLTFEKGFSLPCSMIFMVLCGLCTSVMWGGIFNMAAEGLGKYVPMGSGIFMAMVVGGLMLPVQGLIADVVGNLNSYWFTIGLLVYILFYALIGSRVTKRAE